jgi:hypothetical protein
MSITCTVCGTVNPDGTTYCEGCGVELSALQAAVPTPADPPQAPADTVTASSAQDGYAAAPAAVTASPAVQTPDTPELAAGVPDMPLDTGAQDSAGAPLGTPQADSADVTAEPVDAHTAMTGAVSTPSAPAAPAAPADAPAKLGIKKYGAPTGEFIPLQGERLVVGRFDASSGPVDIDLTGLGGQEHISRRHAELYRDQGGWTVRDLGSTNGVYVKRAGESTFSPRLQEPAALHDGDEVAFGNLMLTFHQG